MFVCAPAPRTRASAPPTPPAGAPRRPLAPAPAVPAPAPAAAGPPRRDVRVAGRRGDVLLVAEGLSKTHDGDRMLFRGLSFTIQ
jgi:3-oxoacyl-ACP reductase-like protein